MMKLPNYCTIDPIHHAVCVDVFKSYRGGIFLLFLLGRFWLNSNVSPQPVFHLVNMIYSLIQVQWRPIYSPQIQILIPFSVQVVIQKNLWHSKLQKLVIINYISLIVSEFPFSGRNITVFFSLQSFDERNFCDFF